MNTKHYTYRVIWSDEDQEFIGLCAEFPSLSWLDEDQMQALAGIVRLVDQTVQDMLSAGETMPEPLSHRKFSGKISLRTTPETHRALVLAAAEHNVSLNRHICALLNR